MWIHMSILQRIYKYAMGNLLYPRLYEHAFSSLNVNYFFVKYFFVAI